jgi:hypothetical protein
MKEQQIEMRTGARTKIKLTGACRQYIRMCTGGGTEYNLWQSAITFGITTTYTLSIKMGQ